MASTKPAAIDRGWVNSLSMVGLTLLWLTTYAIVCAVNGKLPSVTESDVPSRVFSIGGVLGAQRPVIEVVWRVVCSALFGIGALAICDVFYARHTKARWFALHVIANGWISLLCLPDLYAIFSDPIKALTERETVNHWPTSLVFSVHMYHMIFFRNLAFIDWLHHILMVVIGAPLLITGEVGHLMNFNHFFMCGVPGGADYAMLFAVKHGWMDPLTEKRYNAAINVWVREPALIVVATCGFIQIHAQKHDELSGWGVATVRAFLMLLAAWNGLFFMERVVGNYHVNAYKAKLQQREMKLSHKDAAPAPISLGANGNGGGQSSPDSAPPGTPNVYETSDHFSGSLPFMGMRVSVSKDDLKQLQKEGGGGNYRRAPDAYPTGEEGKKWL